MAALSFSHWLGVALLVPSLALACDACDEDKMAATSDEVVQETATAQKVVVYCNVQGQVKPERLREAAAKVPGLDLASVRTSTEPAAMSFALDTQVMSAEGAVARISDAIAGAGSITLLKSVGPDSGGTPSR